MSELSRYARQTVFPGIGVEGQHKLLTSRVAIVGMGALGTVLANNLARAGVGFLRLCDRDFVERHNLQRQVLFDEADAEAGTPKAIAAATQLARVNSAIHVEPVVTDVTAENIHSLIADVDVVLDGTDNFETRYLINDACVQAGKPWVYSGAVASYGMTMTIVPGQTACLRCLFPEPMGVGRADTCETAGVLNGVVGVIASIASTEAIKLLVGADSLNAGLVHIDLWTNSYERFPLTRRPGCPTCDHHEYPFLDEAINQTATLCGRDAVQVRPSGLQQLDLAGLGTRLASVGQVRVTPYVLRFTVNGYEMTIFPDGRAIIKGVSEPSLARSLYAKYIGH